MDLQEILQDAKKKIQECGDINSLLHEVKSSIFGKNSDLTKLLTTMKDLTQDAKKELGQKINNVKNEIENVLTEKREELEMLELQKKLTTDALDGTLPYRQQPQGSLHIITKTELELCKIFTKYGFQLASGFDIEEDYYNFTALNVKKNHPARQMQDTFYLQGKNEANENEKWDHIPKIAMKI